MSRRGASGFALFAEFCQLLCSSLLGAFAKRLTIIARSKRVVWSTKLHSVRVKPGDRIRRGDVIGLLGNTGNTSNPHVHFHIMDGPSPLASNGLPFVIVNFTDQGVGTAIEPAFEGKPVVIDPKMAGPHRDSLPLNNHIVSFE
jgi:Peptidase family M23